jgi:hypothetical protein
MQFCRLSGSTEIKFLILQDGPQYIAEEAIQIFFISL